MRIAIIALAAAGLAGALTLTANPAAAAPQNQAQAKQAQASDTAPAAKKAQRQPRSRVIVRQRSYLHPGTEALPNSEQTMTDRVMPYGYSAVGTALGPTYGWDRRPFNDPWDTPQR
jgi:hypothetical protein